MTQSFDVVIVGGGQGGAQAALLLRHEGFSGSIAIVGDEHDPPYDRPPLSKDYLSGAKGFDQLLFHTQEAWTERGVVLILGEPVVAIDPTGRHLTLRGGSHLTYGKLIWSAGGTPRRLDLPGADLAGLHAIRSRYDVDRMIGELPDVKDVVVIGGGYVGLEAAAVLSKIGKQVTVLEAQDRVLARVAGEPLSRFYEAEHRSHGVDVRLDVKISGIAGHAGRAVGVRLADASLLPAQMVIVGIGIDPQVDPLISAGAVGSGGVRVDANCRTSLEDIYAIGDCAEHLNDFANGAVLRLESVQNANDQAKAAALSICGRPEPYAAVPWFWSNQYDLKLQTIGLSAGADDLVVRGDPQNRSFSVIYMRKRQVIALDCVNAVRDYSQGRGLVVARARPDRSALADPKIPLKSHLAASVGP